MKFLNVAIQLNEFSESPIGFTQGPPQPKNFSGRTFLFRSLQGKTSGKITERFTERLSESVRNWVDKSTILLTVDQEVDGSSPSASTRIEGGSRANNFSVSFQRFVQLQYSLDCIWYLW